MPFTQPTKASKFHCILHNLQKQTSFTVFYAARLNGPLGADMNVELFPPDTVRRVHSDASLPAGPELFRKLNILSSPAARTCPSGPWRSSPFESKVNQWKLE